MGLLSKIKEFLTPSEDMSKTLTVSEHKRKQNINKTLTLNSAFNITSNSLRVITIIGKQGRGKTTTTLRLVDNLATAYDKVVFITDKPKEELKPIFEQNNLSFYDKLETVSDIQQILGYKNAIVTIDDLCSSVAKSVLTKVSDLLRASRHNNLAIIITHHLISQIPTLILQLSEKVIFFQTSFNATVNSKLSNIISKRKLEKLHDLVLSLQKFQYVLVQNNKVYGIFSNLNINPIISEPNQVDEIKLTNQYQNVKTVKENNNNLLEAIYQRIPEFDLLTLTDKVKALNQEFPRLKPRHIAKIVNSNPNTVRVLLCRIRNH